MAMIKARPAAKTLLALAIGGVYFSASSARAHHSPLLFDMTAVVAFEGTVSRVHWANPHSYYYVEAPGADGELIEWQLETDAITLLLRSGWTEETLRPGDRVVVRGHPDRDQNRAHALIESIRTEDGTVLTSVPGQLESPAASSLSGQWAQFTTNWGQIFQQLARVPLTERGAAAKTQFDPRTDDPVADCIGYPPPAAQILKYYVNEIDVQDDRVIIRNEFLDSERIVYLDGRKHPANGPRSNEGHSIGRWEDGVLIVDTTNFSDYRSTFPGRGIPSGDQKHLVERYALSEDGTRIVLDFVLEDPEYLAEPFAARIEWEHSPHLEMLSFGCDLENARLYLGPSP
jgi:hypothetical protein